MISPTSSTRRNVIALDRVSTAEQADKEGLARQRAQIESAITRHNLNIIRWETVIDVSGRHVAHDPQFQEIFKDLESGAADGVVVAELSRLVRPEDPSDFGIFDHFKKNGRKIYTPSDVIDLNTRGGRMQSILGGMMAGEELHTMRERLDGGKQSLRKKGKHPGGQHMLPRGVVYRRVFDPETGRVLSATWEHDGIDSVLVLKAYHLLFDGDSYELIAEKIGNGWTGKGIRATLMNPVWKGIRCYRYEASGEEFLPKPTPKNPTPKFRRKLTLRAVPLEVKIDLAPLVTDDEWNRAQEIIESRKTRWRKSKLKNADRPRHLAAGIARCSCGQPLYNVYGGRGSHLDTYRCSSCQKRGTGCGMRPVKRADFDAALESIVSTKLVDAKLMMQILSIVRAAAEAKPDPSRLQAEAAVAKFEAGRKELLAMVTAGDMTRAEFREQVAVLERNKAGLLAALPAPAPAIDERALVEMLFTVFAEFEFLSFVEKRALLKRTVREIVLQDNAITALTVNGGIGVNSLPRSTARSDFNSHSDIVIRFPEPIQITSTYVDGRSKNGHHPENIAALARGRVTRWRSEK